ncbi:MAG: MDR family oxidoreductase [Gammaproteobacteria bacterium]|nr:MDR family oxidoreductase [Gammaproteobacteria bacterium]
MNSFSAFYATESEQGPLIQQTTLTQDDLMPGNVTVQVKYSTINYKDALALTGSAPILRKLPIIPGIDFAGEVIESSDERFSIGDEVLLNGFGVGETHSGGYAQMARVNADWLVRLPNNIDCRQAMAIGTAGYTAMLCILALEDHGVNPDDGPVLVTGASGGVGSVAVSVLSKLGYSVSASTGKLTESDYLKSLGAIEVVDRNDFAQKPRPLGKELWAAAVDVAGGQTLANVLSQTRRAGAVAACGLAESMDLPTSVAPFILRGITLYGIDSVMCPMERRIQAWSRLSQDLDLERLESMTSEIPFDDLPAATQDLLAGKLKGRTVVKLPD